VRPNTRDMNQSASAGGGPDVSSAVPIVFVRGLGASFSRCAHVPIRHI
jgi:hypothetical protein